MASISNDKNGTRRIIISTSAGRKTVRVGKMPLKDAQQVAGYLDHLNAAAIAQTAPPVKTAQWLAEISDTLHRRIVRAGLCGKRAPTVPAAVLTVGTLHQAYIDRRTDLKPGTVLVMQQAKRQASAFFGADREAATINVAEAKDFRRHLAGQYSEAYTAKMIRECRIVWKDAVEREHLAANPFAAVKVGSAKNAERQFFVDRVTIDRVIDQAPDPQWKLLIALSRYAGLRCPSEHLAMTWADVDWANNRMLVRSSKTEHHAGKATRLVPIFPELRPHLQKVYDEAEPGETHVITRYRFVNSNLRTQFERYILAAGCKPWPRLFHNLRASCQTDLTERFPAHVVCAWIGNSEVVARDHYLQVTEGHFQKAAGVAGPPAAAPEKAAQKAAQQIAATVGNAPQGAPLTGNRNEKTAFSIENAAYSWERQDSNL